MTVTPFSLIPKSINKNAYKVLFNDENIENLSKENMVEKARLIQEDNKKNILNFFNDINLLFEFLDFF